ncbi:MAG: choice-of-anchor J domain-containing protein [Prolixibacteraceae bacterium]|jgi:hypothetical protein|nr:choice-of-anchor J domain-containing protein [Prolixibacteraceae bacterium]
MKYLKYITLALMIAFSSCNMVNPLEEELDEIGNDFNQEINYTLTDDDYNALNDHILYRDSSNVEIADFIVANKYLTNEIPSTEYLPILLEVLWPNLEGAKANITFNFNGEAPAELTKIAAAKSYTIDHSDYEKIDSTLGFLNYFAPPYIPGNYIPNILKHNVKYEGTPDTVVVEYQYSDNQVKVDFTKQINAEFSEFFDDSNLGLFEKIDLKGSQSWKYVPKDNGAALINGYDDKIFDNEDWLISPVIDLTEVTNTHLRLKHNVRYYENESLQLLVTTDINSPAKEANWSDYQINNPGTEIDEYVYSNFYNLTSYDGKKIKIALKYTSSADASKAPEWSVSEIMVGNYDYKVVGGGNNYFVQHYYQFDSINAKWLPIEDITRLNKNDFEKFDLPANAFSESLPAKDYISEFADEFYPNASVEDEVYFVYDYDDGSIHTIADKLKKTETGWLSTYSYVQEVTEPYRRTNGTWKFDPSEILEMGEEDYQIIIDYVNSVPEYAEKNTSEFENSEYYFGASAYFGNFDTRPGSFSDDFSSWEEAIKTALLEGFLPNKYPNATKFVNGVEVFYYITFETYNGARQNYTCIFGVSKDAPNPEFYLIEGPNELK